MDDRTPRQIELRNRIRFLEQLVKMSIDEMVYCLKEIDHIHQINKEKEWNTDDTSEQS